MLEFVGERGAIAKSLEPAWLGPGRRVQAFRNSYAQEVARFEETLTEAEPVTYVPTPYMLAMAREVGMENQMMQIILAHSDKVQREVEDAKGSTVSNDAEMERTGDAVV